MGNEDLALQFRPPRSPDLISCDFFSWGFVKDAVYVPPLPTNLNDLRNRITAAVNSVTQDIRHEDWDEFNYCLHVIRAAGGRHIEHMDLSSVSIRTPLLTVLNYKTSNDPLYVRFEINFLL